MVGIRPVRRNCVPYLIDSDIIRIKLLGGFVIYCGIRASIDDGIDDLAVSKRKTHDENGRAANQERQGK